MSLLKCALLVVSSVYSGVVHCAVNSFTAYTLSCVLGLGLPFTAEALTHNQWQCHTFAPREKSKVIMFTLSPIFTFLIQNNDQGSELGFALEKAVVHVKALICYAFFRRRKLSSTPRSLNYSGVAKHIWKGVAMLQAVFTLGCHINLCLVYFSCFSTWRFAFM